MSSENSVFVKDKTIVFSGLVDHESVGKIMMTIRAFEDDDNDNAAHIKDYKREPINLIISTQGGSVYDALGLVDMIESCKTPVHTYAYGKIMSAGIYIYVAGHKRFCGKFTTFMYHESQATFDDCHSILNSRSKEMDRLEKVMNGILMSKTKITEKKLKEWHNEREAYIDSIEALKLGIVNEIL